MSVMLQVADQAQTLHGHFQVQAFTDNCNLVTPIKGQVDTLFGSLTGLVKYLAGGVFVVAIFCLLIPHPVVRGFCVVYIIVYIVIALFAPGLVGLGNGLLGNHC